MGRSAQGHLDAATPKDGYTAEVARLSRLVGIDLGSNKEELEALVQGALLHDLGKLGVADAILGKPDALSEGERAAVKRHPEIGAQMIEPIEPLSGAVPVVRHHHERQSAQQYGERVPPWVATDRKCPADVGEEDDSMAPLPRRPCSEHVEA